MSNQLDVLWSNIKGIKLVLPYLVTECYPDYWILLFINTLSGERAALETQNTVIFLSPDKPTANYYRLGSAYLIEGPLQGFPELFIIFIS